MILLAMGALVLAACGGDNDNDEPDAAADDPAAEAEDEPADGEPAGDPTTITFWNGFTDADRPIVEEIVRRFNESQDEVVVDMTIDPWDVLIPSLLPAYSAGEGPTIVGLGAEQFPGLVEQGAWAPVDEVYDSGLLDPATMPQASIDATTYEGARYGVPMASAAGMLYYNNDLLAGAGLDGPPASLAELADYAVQMTSIDPDDETASRYGLALPDHAAMPTWAVLLWADGGGIVAEDNSRSILADPESIEAAEFWTDLIVNENISPVGMSGVEGDNLFIAERAAMVINGPWASGAFTEAGIDYGIAPVPAGRAAQVAAAVSVNMHVDANATAGEAASAHEFMAFWNSEESQAYWSINAGFPPNRTDVPASAVAENPTAAAFSEAVGARLYLQGLTQATQIDNDVVIPTIQRMTQGEGTPQELLTDAAAQIDAMLGG
jgi:multiple sugar transport system substrate-binding protein